MIHLWHHLLQLGSAHGVNPWLFGALYLIHHPLFWGTMAWLALRARQKRPVAGVIVLAAFFWLMPYAYIFLFGRGFPWWAYAAALLLLALGAPHAVKEVRRRLRRPEPL